MACISAAVRRLPVSVCSWTSVSLRALGQHRAATAAVARSHVGTGRRWCSATTPTRGRVGLLSCVEEEVSLEQQLVQDLPEVTGFTATATGCLATLEREHDGERYVVECVRSHHSIKWVWLQSEGGGGCP
jgi:hypothetical protein